MPSCSQTADMGHALQGLEQKAALASLKINISKTKEMCLGWNILQKFTIQSQEIEQVTQFWYLGSVITSVGGADGDLEIAKIQQAFSILNKNLVSAQIGRTLKLRIFNMNVKSVLLHGCESWKISK